MVRAECPQCACGDVSFLGPEKLRKKFIGDEKEIEILCPFCGTKHKGSWWKSVKKKNEKGRMI
jgi:redox-regulated HSP33 family molecular chaperone